MKKIDEIGAAVMRWQDLAQAFDEAAAAEIGVSLREMRCLSALHRGPCSASELANEVKLSPAAMTALIDRLEAKDLVRRRRDTVDRRKVLVEQTENADAFATRFYGPIARDGEAFLRGFGDHDLDVIARYMQGAIELQERHLAEMKTPIG